MFTQSNLRIIQTIAITLTVIALAIALSGGTSMAASFDASPALANLVANVDAGGIDVSHLYEAAGYATLAALAVHQLAHGIARLIRARKATRPIAFPYRHFFHAMGYALVLIGITIALTRNVI